MNFKVSLSLSQKQDNKLKLHFSPCNSGEIVLFFYKGIVFFDKKILLPG